MFEVWKLPCSEESRDFFTEGLANSGELSEAVGADKFLEIGRGGFKRPCGGEVGPAFERILALEFENRANLPKGARSLILGH